ncbi:MAG: 3-deoxy-manno-octulosonate cytidylyltransferase [Candidatus Cloacimonetes bacterium]|nr:3-deoxy-manno-octulosonate cytidylyltransferase [Candidatus Cloacimonadota bacterium]
MSALRAAAVIPARWASTRFPGKPLARLAGRLVIEHVWDAVHSSGLFDEAVVATDDQRVADAVKAFGGNVAMTSPRHASGSDRVAEVAGELNADIIVNVQGDEPFLTAAPLRDLLAAFDDPDVQVASLMHHLQDETALHDPNRVKVVCACNGDALYFSRAAIPYGRDMGCHSHCYVHIGVYAYRRQTLLRFVHLPHGRLEETEKLEQLRLLEHGIPIRMVATDYRGIGIDTPNDLVRAEELFDCGGP